MQRLGIDQALHDVYENIGNLWRAILPLPIISLATLDPDLPMSAAPASEIFSPIFREESFDLVTRIRRGRFYVPAPGPRPSQEWALPHPTYGTLGSLITQRTGQTERSLYVYDLYQRGDGAPPKFVALGSPESLWRVLYCERTITGELLFTLKARHGMGILPDIDAGALPSRGREKAIETIDKLIDSACREAPGSIIDRARDAAQWCLATWLAAKSNDESLLTEELGKLIRKAKDSGRETLPHAAELVRLLHSRVKPNEQERYGASPVMEDDAELALRAVGFLIREFGWAQPT